MLEIDSTDIGQGIGTDMEWQHQLGLVVDGHVVTQPAHVVGRLAELSIVAADGAAEMPVAALPGPVKVLADTAVQNV